MVKSLARSRGSVQVFIKTFIKLPQLDNAISRNKDPRCNGVEDLCAYTFFLVFFLRFVTLCNKVNCTVCNIISIKYHSSIDTLAGVDLHAKQIHAVERVKSVILS